ncbi:putative zinc finger, CCHC-type containing protein [Tanacetum coccineum]
MSSNNLFSRSSSSSFRQSSASKIDQLYEISYVPDDSRIPVSEMPLVNPYQIFTKPTNSITKRVKQLIGSAPNKQIKEFIQTSKFDSHQLPASQVEHLVSLSLPSDLPRHCLAQGYTHIHFGAIRLALTFHGRKGLPAYSRIALLDTRFVEYQHACIGTIQTTLNAGTIFVTFYPNFNMPLNDPSLLTALKAQIQIGGTPQVNTFQATFHYQMAYRVQNHSLDILVPGQDNAGDALLIDVDSNATPTCTYVPRQLSQDELVKLLPEKLITNYEQIHQAPVRSTSAPEFVRHENGLVNIKFSSSQPKCFSHRYSYDHTNRSGARSRTLFSKVKSPIVSTISSGRSKTRIVGVGLEEDPSSLWEAIENTIKRKPLRRVRKVLLRTFSVPLMCFTVNFHYALNVPLLILFFEEAGIFSGCIFSARHLIAFTASRFPPACVKGSVPLPSGLDPTWLCGLATPSGLEATIGPTGHANTISPAEATLNWQSENVVAQNKVLVKILSQQGMITNSQEYLSSRVRSLESIINELHFKIQELHREIIQIIRTSPTTQPSSSISQKEAEMKNLKNQLQDLERQHKQKRITSLIDDPWRLPSTPFVGVSFDPQPLPRSYTHTTSPSLNIWVSEQRRLKPSTRMEPTFSQESQFIADVVASTKTHDVLPIQKVNPVSMYLNSLTQTDKPQNPQFIAPVIKPQKDYEQFDNVESFEYLFMAKPENAESTVQFDVKEYEEHQENPNQETPTEFPKSDIKQYFTFDDVPPSKWRERSIEMLTCLGEYRQLQIQQSISPKAFMNDEPSDSVLCTIAYSDFSSDDDSHTDSLESDSNFGVHMINPIPHVLPIQEDPPLPLAKVHHLTDAYAKPIPVIAFFDTGSSVSILNPNILPDHYWKPHHQNFMAANGEKFVIEKIKRPY